MSDGTPTWTPRLQRLALACLGIGVGVGAVVDATLDRRRALLVAALFALLAIGCVYELWRRLWKR